MEECSTDNAFFSKLTSRLVNMIAAEMGKEGTQSVIKEKMISPLLQVIFKEIHQYIYALFILISLTLLISTLTFVLLLVMYTLPRARI